METEERLQLNREQVMRDLDESISRKRSTSTKLDEDIKSRIVKIDSLGVQQFAIEQKINEYRTTLNDIVLKQHEAQKKYEEILPIINSFPEQNANLIEKIAELNILIEKNQELLEQNNKAVEILYKNPQRIDFYVRGLQKAIDKKGKIDILKELALLNI